MRVAALLVSLVAVCALAASLAGALAALSSAWAERLRLACAATSLRAALIVAPVAVAVLALAALLLPHPLSGCHCATHESHHPHLCLGHPDSAEALFVPAALLTAMWLAVTIPRLVKIAREIGRLRRWADRLRALAPERVDGVEVRVVDGMGCGAFTVGVGAPVIAVDRELWSRLSEEEKRAVAHHEDAHVKRRDGLTLIALRVASALPLWPLGDRPVDAWRAAAELCCDRHAARAVGDPAAVAQALVSVERVRAASFAGSDATSALAMAADGDLEHRVLALLAYDARPRSGVLGNDLLAVGFVLASAVLCTVAWPGGAFHHAVETLAGLALH